MQHIKVNSNIIFRWGKSLKTKNYLSILLGKAGTYSTGYPFKNISLKEGALLEGDYFTKDGSH